MGIFRTEDQLHYRRWVNLVPAAVMSGGAHFLAGKRRRGAIWFLIHYFLVTSIYFFLFSPINRSETVFKLSQVVFFFIWLIMLADSCITPIPRLRAKTWTIYVLIAIAIPLGLFLTIRQFLFQPFKTPTYAMEPTLLGNEKTPEGIKPTGDQIICDKMSYWFHPPQRGDIIVFSTAGIDADARERFRIDSHEDQVKRVVGLPRETISLQPPYVLINGKILDNPSIFKKISGGEDGFSGYTHIYASSMIKESFNVIGTNEYFVLGDNSKNSLDSRYYGSIKASSIKGKVTWIFRPFDRKGAPE